MVYAPPRKTSTEGEPVVARPHDHGGDRPHQATFTVTLVGLVTMS